MRNTSAAQVEGQDLTVLKVCANRTDGKIRIKPTVTIRQAGSDSSLKGKTLVCKPGKQTVEIPYSIAKSGPVDLTLELGDNSDFRAEASFHVASLFDTSYGEALPASDGTADVWWASSGHKISRSRPSPKAKGKAVRIQTAKNEVDAAQIVILASPPGPSANRSARVPVKGVLRVPEELRPFLRIESIRPAQITVSRLDKESM